MITKEILACCNSDVIKSESIARVERVRITEINFDSIQILVNFFQENGIRDSDSFVCINCERLSEFMSAGNAFGWDLFEMLEVLLKGEFEFYKMGNRLCADLVEYTKSRHKHIQHFEILKLTNKGLELIKSNSDMGMYSDCELALLLVKSPMLAIPPFSKEEVCK